MTTAADAALHEARALRLVLAAIREDEDAVLASQVVFNEINSIDDMKHVMGILAAYVAEEMTIANEKKAARQVEKRLAFLLDFAARGIPDGDHQ